MIICSCKIDDFIKEITGRDDTDAKPVQIRIVSNGTTVETNDKSFVHDGSTDFGSFFFIGTFVVHQASEDALIGFNCNIKGTNEYVTHKVFPYNNYESHFFNNIRPLNGIYQLTFIGYKIATVS